MRAAKTLSLILVALSALPLKLPAGSVGEVDGKTTIHVKVFDLPDPSNRVEYEVVQAFVDKFPKLFAEKYRDKYKAAPGKYGKWNWDNVGIVLDKFSGIRVEGVETDYLAIAGGLAPDILYLNFKKSDNYIQSNFLYPLDEYYATMPKAETDLRINPKLWPVIRRKGSDGKTHAWALPYGGALGKVLLYRMDLFDKAGLPYPDSHWTWDDMLNACKKITDPAKGVYGISLGKGKTESAYWTTFLWSAGADDMVHDKKTDQWTCVFDSPEAAVALDFYTRLCTEKWVDKEGEIRRGYATKDPSASSQKWENGEIGMMFRYVDERLFATINPDLVGMCPVPLGPTGKRGAELNSMMMALFSQVKDPVVRDAAWEYMLFYDSLEAMAIRTRLMVEAGLGAFINPKYLRLFGYKELEYLTIKGLAETYEIAIETGRPEPYAKNCNYMYELLTQPIEEADVLSVSDKLPADRKQRLAALQGLLRTACARANEVMIGKIPPAEKTKRRAIAMIALVVIISSFCFFIKKIYKLFSPPSTAIENKRNELTNWRYVWAYILLIPALLTILIWSYIPLVRGSVIAFYDYKILGDSIYVGLDNFGNAIVDSYWWESVWNSLRYSLLVLALTFLPPVILAVMLQEITWFTVFFRTAFYLPTIITGIVIVLLWKQFFDPSSAGMLNAVLLKIPAIGFLAVGAALLAIALLFARRLKFHELRAPMWGFVLVGAILFVTCAKFSYPLLWHPGEGLGAALSQLPARLFSFAPEPYRWLSDPETAMVACVIPMIWSGVGPGCLIYLAALKGIPDDYYEAADIDGATFLDKIMFIVFPNLKVLIVINFVGAFIGTWYNATGNIMVMTGGGANTEVAGLHIWYQAFTFMQFGPATAMAWMLGFILIGFTIHQLTILSRIEFKRVEKV